MGRLVRTALITFLIAGAIGVPAIIACVFVQEAKQIASNAPVVRRRSPARVDAPPASPSTAQPTDAKQTAGRGKTGAADTESISAESQPKRLYTWAEVESVLVRLRQERKTRPGAYDELVGWYQTLAAPAYTASQDIPEHCTKLAEWRRQFPDSPTPLVVLAKAHLGYAWEARGTGWASTVTTEGWQQFHTRVAEARTLLDRAVQLGVKDGEAHALLVSVAMANGAPHEEAQEIVDAGRQLDPTYHLIYEAMAQYLLPRWHGDPGDIEQFAAEVANRVPGDDGLEAYGRIAFVTHRYDGNQLFRGQFDHSQLVKAAELLVQRYPDSQSFTSFAALCTLAAQDHAAARRIRPFVQEGDVPRVPMWRFAVKPFVRWADANVEQTRETNWIWSTFTTYGNIAFADDSRYLWCGQGYAGAPVVLLDLKTRGEKAVLSGPSGSVNDFAFDRDKNWLAAIIISKDFQGWVFWDVAQPDQPLPYPTPEICRVIAINPRRKQIAWAAEKTVRTLDMETRMEGPRIDLEHHVHHLRFSADGQRLAVQSSGVKVYDAATAALVCDLSKPRVNQQSPRPACGHAIDFDEQGRILSSTSITSQGKTTVPLLRFSADGDSVETVIADLGDKARTVIAAASPDRRLLAVPRARAAGVIGEAIEVWDLETGQLCQSLGGHESHIGTLVFSSDGRQLASIALMGGVIKIWSLDGQASQAASTDLSADGSALNR